MNDNTTTDTTNTTPETTEPAIAIRDEYQVHKLNETGMRRAQDVAKLFSAFTNDLESQCGGNGRAMALVRTKLQEASFFAKRAIAEQLENQEQPATMAPAGE